jgi:hypothetical protein
MDDESAAAIIAEGHVEAAEETTVQVETAADAAVEIARIEAGAEVAIAEAQAAAAVEIAQTEEVDGEWLQSQLSGLADGLQNVLKELADVKAALSAIAGAMIAPAPEPEIAPLIPTSPQPEAPPEAPPIVEPPSGAGAQSQAARKRRLF